MRARALYNVKFYQDVLMAIFAGSMISKIKECHWSTASAIFLLCFYFIETCGLVNLALGNPGIVPDMQQLYILIDLITLTYMIYIKIHPCINNPIFRVLWVYLFGWFIAYTFIDVFVPPIYQPSGVWFYCLFATVNIKTMVLLTWNEIARNKIEWRRLFEW